MLHASSFQIETLQTGNLFLYSKQLCNLKIDAINGNYSARM